jgi:hypothetical protein
VRYTALERLRRIELLILINSAGYRRGHNAAVWYARFYDGAGTYSQEHLGRANDHLEANGETVLTYYQAQEKARQLATRHAKERGIGIKTTTTVQEAAKRYLEWFRDHRKAIESTEAAINAHILPKLGDKPTATLTTRELRDWLNRLAARPPGGGRARASHRPTARNRTPTTPSAPEGHRRIGSSPSSGRSLIGRSRTSLRARTAPGARSSRSRAPTSPLSGT